MKYLIIGAGGTGGVTGYYMKKAGKDVTLIARGEHLKKIQKQGLTLEKMWDKTEGNISIPATDMEHYAEHPGRNFCLRKRLFLTGNDSVYQTHCQEKYYRNSSVEYIWNRWKNAERTAGSSGNGRLHLCFCQH